MTDLISVKIQSNLIEGLQMKFPKFSINQIMEEISKPRKIYTDIDILYAIEQLQGYRKEYPKISIEEICKMNKEYYQNIVKNKSV